MIKIMRLWSLYIITVVLCLTLYTTGVFAADQDATNRTLVVDPSTGDATGVTATNRLKVDIEGSAETSLRLGTRLKIYEETITTGASPKTFNIEADMNTKFSVSDSQVIFFQITPDKDITVKVNSDTEAITVNKGEVFNLNNFDITSIVVTVTNNTAVRIIAEGVAEA